jgi:hypothetical protein
LIFAGDTLDGKFDGIYVAKLGVIGALLLISLISNGTGTGKALRI